MAVLDRQRGFVILAIAAVVILLLFAIAGATWYLINIPDPPLDAGILSTLQERHDTLRPQDNLFFALLAFDSTSGENINQQGQAIYAAYLSRHAQDPSSSVTFENVMPIVRQAFVGDRTSLCGASGKPEDCSERAMAHPVDLRKLVADNHLFEDRYEGVMRYTHLQDPVQRTGPPHASWSPFILGKRIFLTDIAVQLSDGHADQALTRLGPEIAFSRRLLAEPDILLIDKVILAASLRQSLEMASDVLRTHSFGDSQYAQLKLGLTPLTEEERSLVGPMTREFIAVAAMVKDLTTPGSRSVAASSNPSANSVVAEALQAHFIKYNATLNAQWRMLTAKNALSRGGCAKFLSGAAAFKKRSDTGFDSRLYNPIGNILSGITAPVSIEYMHSLCDLDGMIRIVELQTEGRVRHLNTEQLAQFASNTANRHTNPLTAEPMHFDAARMTVDFRPLAQRDQGFFPWPLTEP